MSDFDKEAEREKLREKYERDQENREVAEKMSELLLQGATMTNAHCSECGDPIFRYDGQEFCATCERAVDRDGDGDADDEDADADTENIEVASPDDAQVKFGGDGAEAESESDEQPPTRDAPDRQSAGQGADRQAAPTDAAQQSDPTAESRPAETGEQPVDSPQQTAGADGQSRQSTDTESRQQEPRSVPSVEPSEQGDVTAARESLVRTLTRFSQQAETAEDPQRASEYLAAAREAAEALSALRR